MVFAMAQGCSITKASHRLSNVDAQARVREADRLHDQGRYGEALDRLIQASALPLDEGDRWALSDMLSGGGRLHFQRGEFDLALRYYDAARCLHQDGANRAATARVARIDASKAGIHSYLGQYQEALHQIEQADWALGDGQPLSLRARTKIELAVARFNLRDYDGALDSVDGALRFARDVPDARERLALQADSALVQGMVERQTGKLEAALLRYEACLAMHRQLGDRRSEGGDLRVLGELHKERGELLQAKRVLDAALAIFQAEGDAYSVAWTRLHQAEVCLSEGDFVQSESKFRSAATEFEHIGFLPGVARCSLRLGATYLDRPTPDPRTAEAWFSSAEEKYARIQDRYWQRLARFGIGRCRELRGDLAAAEASYRAAVQIAGPPGSPESRDELIDAGTRDLYQHLLRLIDRRGDEDALAEYLALALGETELPGLEDVVRRVPTGDEVARWSGEFFALHPNGLDGIQTRENFRRFLATALDRQQPARVMATALTLAAEGRRLPDDRHAILAYFVGERELYGLVVRNSQTRAVRIEIPESELIADLFELRGQMELSANLAPNASDDPGDRYPRSLVEASGRLYDVLVRPVKQWIEDVDTLAILRPAVLQPLPFACLVRRGADGQVRFLVQGLGESPETGVERDRRGLAIVYLSAATLGALTSSELRPLKVRDVAVFIGPLGFEAQDAAQNLSSVEGHEISAIRSRFPRADPQTSSTKADFTREWGRHDVVHIIAHGHADEGSPRLLLASDGEIDGRLTASEVAGLSMPDRGRRMLIVLVACSTEVGAQTASDPRDTWLDTMAQAFSQSQPEQPHLVVGTFWDLLRTEALGKFTASYYTELADGVAPHRALAHAQIDLLTRHDRFAQPYHWAAFAHIGPWR